MKSVAILASYYLIPDRIGGMDYFFWQFDQACRNRGVEPVWFFPNKELHGNYKKMQIVAENGKSVEQCFLDYNQPFDTLFTHFVELCTPFFKKARPLVRKNIVAVDHNPRPRSGYNLKIRIKKRFYGVVFGQFIDSFISVSNYYKQFLIVDFGFHLKVKQLVITNGVNTHLFHFKSESKFQKRFIIVSNLRKSKGVTDFLQAVEEIDRSLLTGAVFDIYGDGELRVLMENFVKNKKLSEFIFFKGNTSNLPKLYANYDYLIHPSHEETFCYSIVESLVSGVPVITTNAPGGNVLNCVKDGSNGFVYNAGDTSALKLILTKVLASVIPLTFVDRELYSEQFSLDKMVYSYLTMIK